MAPKPRPQPAWQIYEEQMECLCYGHALWEPAPTSEYTRISIGDVGFVRQGRFHLLFSAGLPLGERERGEDVPSTFEQLIVGKLQTTQPRDPGCVAASTSREVGASDDVTEPILQSLEPGANSSFELTGNRGAALATRYPTYNEDSQVDSAFKKYTIRHYKSWVKFARDKEYGENLRPVLVSGFEMTKDFAIMAYSNNRASVQSDEAFPTPMFGSASASNSWTWRTPCRPHVKHGPQQCRPPSPSQSRAAESPPNEFNQCVFVRYYTMRFEFGLFPRVIRAGAGPHDLGPGDNRGDTFPELTARSSAEPMNDVQDAEEQWDPAISDPGSEDMVIRNVPYDEGHESWDAIAEYVFQNSSATSVLMHHKDLRGIRAMGHNSDISSLLAMHKPRIVVDGDRVGEIILGGDALPSQGFTMVSPQNMPRGIFQTTAQP
ncbi:hypothetical protein BJ322DRAFT_779696 [Thelephora terrestris]|uniref:Uncharacterized protein n=1 Tax=Thelephora terrestris TaxID=56493 RepID=A0A9P6L7R3_9AGAM|nr:hypothetical protein BJ322DRAFT_779696 [Thelephora terrestris]